MMAREHARSGLVAGLGVAVVAHMSPLAGLALAVLTAGAALLPDLDHPSATAARTFGPVTLAIATGLDHLGYAIWRYSATPHDRKPPDGHRTITHTAVFALLMGAVVDLACSWGGRWALLGTLFVLASLAVRGLTAHGPQEAGVFQRRRHHRFHATVISVSIYAAVLTAGAYFGVPAMDPLLVGECVALGCWTHCLGDSLTLWGCPWLWPLPLGRPAQRWYLIGTPQALRFRTGTPEHDGEDRVRRLMNVAIVALAIGLVPSAYATIYHGGFLLYRMVTH